jgi:HTH-type transcriptional regulator, sugar sensing transcriptional regulator
MQEELRILGLNDSEIKVYLVLLETGESLASNIASKADIPRGSIYDILNRLIGRGMVSYIIRDFNKYFKAAEPKTLVHDMNHKMQKIKDIVPDLEKLRVNKTKSYANSELFLGKKGAETIFNMMLEEKEILALGGSRKTEEIMPYFMPKWNTERRMKKINVKMIYLDTAEIRKKVKAAGKTLQPIEYRFLKTDYLSNILTIIFGDKVMLGEWTKEPTSILIESQHIAETYKQYFHKLWRLAKK